MAGIERGSRLLVIAGIADALSVPLPKLLVALWWSSWGAPPRCQGCYNKAKAQGDPAIT
jgi:hypothetical protein